MRLVLYANKSKTLIINRASATCAVCEQEQTVVYFISTNQSGTRIQLQPGLQVCNFQLLPGLWVSSATSSCAASSMESCVRCWAACSMEICVKCWAVSSMEICVKCWAVSSMESCVKCCGASSIENCVKCCGASSMESYVKLREAALNCVQCCAASNIELRAVLRCQQHWIACSVALPAVLNCVQCCAYWRGGQKAVSRTVLTYFITYCVFWKQFIRSTSRPSLVLFHHCRFIEPSVVCLIKDAVASCRGDEAA